MIDAYLLVFIKFKGKRRRGTVLLYSRVVRPSRCLHQAVPVYVLCQRWHSGDGKYTCIKTQSVVDLSFQYYQCCLIPKFHLMDVWYPPLGHALLHVLQ